MQTTRVRLQPARRVCRAKKTETYLMEKKHRQDTWLEFVQTWQDCVYHV
jgi:hypothetical protein